MPNNRVSKYVRQELIELQEVVHESIVIVGELNILLSEVNRSKNHNIDKEIVELINTINKLDMKDIYMC